MPIYSPTRYLDMELRDNYLEVTQIMLRMYKRTGKEDYLTAAKEFGSMSKKLKWRIDNHDYSKEDARRARFGYK